MQGVFLDTATMKPEELDFGALESTGDWTFHERTGPSQVVERLRGAQVVITNKVVLDADIIAAAEALQLICVCATGTNNVDLDAASARGIPVCNVIDYAGPGVAQHTLALMLGLATNWHRYAADVRAGEWSRSAMFCLMDHPVMELAGKTLGIVGYGVLGKAVADMGAALGMRVLVSASLRPGAAPESGRTPLDRLLAESDVVSLHCPQTPETKELINAERLALMKPGAFLVNTARGGLVNEADLAAALRQGRLGGAALDVLSAEPPPADHPLLAADIPNLIITPHCAWVSRECRQRLLDGVVGNIRIWQRGGLQHCVNGIEVA